MVEINSPDNVNIAKVTDTGYLMVCLCDGDGTGLVDGPLLNGAELHQSHQAIKLESLVAIGQPCLLFIEVDGEVVPLTQEILRGR